MASQKKKAGERKAVAEKWGRSEADRSRRFFLVWVPVIILVLAIFYGLMFDPPSPVGEPLTGTINGLERGKTGQPAGSAVLVTLGDGRTIEVRTSGMEGPLQQGRRVLIQENETLIFKRKTYAFVRWLDVE